eukprot:g3515.t1
MPSAKKEKKLEKAREKAFAEATRKAREARKKTKKKKDTRSDREIYEEFRTSGGFAADGASVGERGGAGKKGTKMFKNIARIVQRLCAIAFFGIIVSRKDFFSAFGVGTGISKAHVSPLSVTTRFLHSNSFVKGNFKLKSASNEMVTGLAYLGEMMDEYTAKESVLKKKKNNKKKKGKKKTRAARELSTWERAVEWVEKTRSDRSLRRIVDQNYILSGGAVACIVFGALSILIPDLMMVALMGAGAMTVGSSNQNASANPETCLWVAIGVGMVCYAMGQFTSDAKASKRKMRRRNGRKRVKESGEKRRTSASSKKDD